MHMRNIDSSSSHFFYYLFYFFAATFVAASFFFVIFLSSFRIYSTEASLLVVARDNRTTLNRAEIVNNVAQISQTVNFYERILRSNDSVFDETAGLPKSEARKTWQDITRVDVIEGSHIVKLHFRHKDYQQSRLIAGSGAIELSGIAKAYHNNQIELKLIDNLTTLVTVSSWVKLISLCLTLSLIVVAGIFVVLYRYKIIDFSFRKKKAYSELIRRVAINTLKRDARAMESYVAKKDNVIIQDVFDNKLNQVDEKSDKVVFKKPIKVQLPRFNIEKKQIDKTEPKENIEKEAGKVEKDKTNLNIESPIKEEKKVEEETEKEKFPGREALKAKLKKAVQSGKGLEKVILVKNDKPFKEDEKIIKKEAEEKEEKPIPSNDASQEDKKINLRKKPQLPILNTVKNDKEILEQSSQTLPDDEKKKLDQFGRIGLQYKNWQFGDNKNSVEKLAQSVSEVGSKKSSAPSSLPGNLPGGSLPDYMKLSFQPRGNHIQGDKEKDPNIIIKSLINKSKPISNLPVGLVGGSGSVPKNLPIGSGGLFPYGTREVNGREGKSQSVPEIKLTQEKKGEPSDGDYKERLNQLLRGEL